MQFEDGLCLFEPLLRGACFVIGLIFFYVLEQYWPYQKKASNYRQRWFNHTFLTVLGTGMLRGIFYSIPILFAIKVELAGIGILRSVELPVSVLIILSVIGLDFFMYCQHRAMHHFPLLFRIHRVHHTDRTLDVTTSLRFHPLEIILFSIFKMIGIMFIGAPVVAVFIYEVMFCIANQWAHSNLHLPPKYDTYVSKWLVTPQMHHLHHSDELSLQRANFGFCFSIWDHLLGTFKTRHFSYHSRLIVGLAHYFECKFDELTTLLCMPLNLKRCQPTKQHVLPKHKVGNIPNE